jgi:type I restriction enzyme R subunit
MPSGPVICSYPPDKQEKATQTVLEQAEVLSGIWAGA